MRIGFLTPFLKCILSYTCICYFSCYSLICKIPFMRVAGPLSGVVAPLPRFNLGQVIILLLIYGFSNEDLYVCLTLFWNITLLIIGTVALFIVVSFYLMVWESYDYNALFIWLWAVTSVRMWYGIYPQPELRLWKRR